MLTTGKTGRNSAYDLMAKTWQKMRDSIRGEERIKNESLRQNERNLEGRLMLAPIKTFDQYIRPTDLMRRESKTIGYQRFCDYIFRAKYYPFPLEIQQQSLGLIENQPADFELPTAMEGMLSNATVNKEPLLGLLSTVNKHQIQVSRVGLLLEPCNTKGKPFNIATYVAESIVDWAEIPDENSEPVLVWAKLATGEVDSNDKPIFLILMIDGDGNYQQYQTVSESVQYGDDWTVDDGYIAESAVWPTAAENPSLIIPFVIVNLTTLGTKIERPFLESVTDAALSLYRASAHYEDAMYWGGESTLFTRGYGLQTDKEIIYTGNGAVNRTSEPYAEAHYATMGTDGIAPRKDNKNSQFDYCVSLGVDLMNQGTESGTALNIRSNVKTASLKTLAITGAHGLGRALKIGAEWLGLSADDVVVTANTTFADVAYTAEEFAKFASLISIGAMRPEDYYTLQVRNNLTSAETFEEWEGGLKKPEPAPVIPPPTDE